MASFISISLVKLFPIKISMETACQCPFSSTFMISGLTLIKSVYGLNIPFVKIETTSTYSAVLSWLDFVGFLVTSALYRIGALILFWGYFNVSAIIPMIAIFLLGICVNSKTLFDQDNIPNWLLVFMNLFVPICFTTKTNEDISKIQSKNLKWQTWNCSIIYGLALIVLGLLVSYSKLNMNESIPINYQVFLIFIITTLSLGLLATVFSFRLELSESIKSLKKIAFNMIKIPK